MNTTVEIKSLDFQNFASATVEAISKKVASLEAWQRGMQRKKNKDSIIRNQKNSRIEAFKNAKR